MRQVFDLLVYPLVFFQIICQQETRILSNDVSTLWLMRYSIFKVRYIVTNNLSVIYRMCIYVSVMATVVRLADCAWHTHTLSLSALSVISFVNSVCMCVVSLIYVHVSFLCLCRMFEWIRMYRDIEELIMLTLQLEEAFKNKVSFDCRLSLHAAHTHTCCILSYHI